MWRRVPLLFAFGEFARQRGAQVVADLPAHVDAFVAERVRGHRGERTNGLQRSRWPRRSAARSSRCWTRRSPASSAPAGRTTHDPFAEAVPGFFEYLVEERGLRPASVRRYRHHLDRFEAYLGRVGVRGLRELSPALLSAFVAERSAAGLAKTTVRDGCGVLRVFLRYAHREGVLGQRPEQGRGVAAGLPAVRHPAVDLLDRGRAGARRRRPAHPVRQAGLRDLAAAGDLRPARPRGRGADPGRHRLEARAAGDPRAQGRAFHRVPAVGRRSARRSSTTCSTAGRQTTDRHVFFRAVAPLQPIGSAAVSACARHYLLEAGIQVPRPGSHTLRHTCVQRLVDADFALKDDRRLRRAPLAGVDGDLRQGRRRVAAPGRPRRRRGGARDELRTLALSSSSSSRTSGRSAASTISEERELRLLVRFADEHGVRRLDQLTPALLEDFLASRPRPRPRSFNHLLGVVAASSTGPSPRSCWRPRRCRPGGAG